MDKNKGRVPCAHVASSRLPTRPAAWPSADSGAGFKRGSEWEGCTGDKGNRCSFNERERSTACEGPRGGSAATGLTLKIWAGHGPHTHLCTQVDAGGPTASWEGAVRRLGVLVTTG